MFVVQYDLSDMPSNSQSFIRQKTYYMPKSFDCDGGKAAKPTDSSSSINSNHNSNNKLNSTSNAENGQTSSNESSNHKIKLNVNQPVNLSKNSNQPTSLTASLSTANLQTASTLPINLAKSSKTITSKLTKNQPDLCNVKFKSSWLRYLIHLRFLSTKSGKIYLHRNIRCLILRRNEFDPGNLVGSKSTFHWVTEQITEHANK